MFNPNIVNNEHISLNFHYGGRGTDTKDQQGSITNTDYVIRNISYSCIIIMIKTNWVWSVFRRDNNSLPRSLHQWWWWHDRWYLCRRRSWYFLLSKLGLMFFKNSLCLQLQVIQNHKLWYVRFRCTLQPRLLSSVLLKFQ